MQKHLILVVLFVLNYSVSFAEDTPVRPLHPKPHETYEVKEDRIYFRHGQAGLILEVATPEKIQKYFEERGANLGNPFVSFGGDLQNATIFLLTLVNRTNGNLTFTPRYVLAKIKSDAYFPLDYTVLLDIIESDNRQLAKIVEKSIFHSPELLQSGKIVSKFLVFPELPKKIGELRLEFDYMYFENFELKSKFYFTTK